MSDWSNSRYDLRAEMHRLRRAVEQRRVSPWLIFAVGVLVGGFFF